MAQKILCVGDSHTGPVRDGLARLSGDMIVIGGPLPRHSHKWIFGFHAGDGQKRHLTIPEMQEGLENYLRPHGIDAGNLMTLGIPAVYSFLTPHFLYTAVHNKLATGAPGIGIECYSNQLVDEMVSNYLHHVMELFCALKAAEVPFVSVLGAAPHRGFAHFGPTFLRIQQSIVRLHERHGIPYADITARTSTPMGTLLPEFIPDREGDFIHGNLAWGTEVAREVVRILKL